MHKYWSSLRRIGLGLLGNAGSGWLWLPALIVTIFWGIQEQPRVTLTNAKSDQVCWRNLGGGTLDFTFRAQQPFLTSLELLMAGNVSAGKAGETLRVEIYDAESRKRVGKRIFSAQKVTASGRFCKIQLGTQWRSEGRLYRVEIKTADQQNVFRLGYEGESIICREIYRSPWPVAAFWGWAGTTLLLWLLRFRIRRTCPVSRASGHWQRLLGEDTPYPWLLLHPLPLLGATLGGLGLAMLIHRLTVAHLCTHLPFFVSGYTLFQVYDKCADMRFLWVFLGGTLLLWGGFAVLNRRFHWVTSYGWSAERGLIPALKHESLCYLILLGGGAGWALGRQCGASGLAWGILGFILLLGVWGWRGTRTVRHGVMALLQVIIALGYLRLLWPAAQMLCGETLIPAAAAWWRYGVLVLLLLAWGDVGRRWRQGRSLVSPLAVAPFALFLLPLGPAELAASNDNYHFGERLVPYWESITFGVRYFQDLILPHGWSDTVGAGLGATIYGQNGNVAISLGGLRFGQLASLGVFIALFWSGLRLRAVVPVILSCGILGNCANALIFGVVGALAILRLRKMPFGQLGLYGVGSFLLAMYHTSIGVVTVCASLPLGGLLLGRCVCRTRSWQAWAKWGLLLVIATGILVIWGHDAWYMIDSTLTYARVNRWAFGNEWYAYRLWVEMALACLIWPLLLLLSVKYWLWYRLRNPALTYLLLVMLLVPLLIDNYATGRIDFFFRRHWLVSGAYLGMLLPLAVYEARCHWPRFWRVAWSVLVLWGGLWFVLMVGTGRHTAEYRDETLRHWGAGTWMKPSDYHVYDRLRRAVPQGGESSFLNLSNGGAIYYYLGKKTLIPHLAFYNIAAAKQEDECVKLLREKGFPAVIYLGPEVINDGVTQMLRINRIMVQLLSSRLYRPVTCDGFDFLVRQPESGTLGEAELKLLDRMVGQRELGHLPRHYGAAHLERLLTPDGLPVTTGRSGKSLKIDFVTRGDYLLFRHVGKKEQDFVLRLTEYESELRFRCGPNERMIVPLTLMPSWVLYGPEKPGTFLLSSPSGEVAVTDVEMRKTPR